MASMVLSENRNLSSFLPFSFLAHLHFLDYAFGITLNISSFRIYSTMVRGKIAMKRIESTTARQVTFSKRRKGFFKKATELSVLCDAEVAVIAFSSTGKLYDFCSTSMEDILDKYERNFQGKEQRPQIQEKLNQLQHRQRQLLGEDLEGLSPTELQTLESRLETTLKRVRTHKAQRLLKNVNELQNKGKIMVEDNNILRKQLRGRQGMSINLNTKENEADIPLKHGEYIQPYAQCISTIMDFTFNKQTISDQEDFNTTLHLGLTTTS